MGLFGNSKENRERKEIKNQVDKLMKQYDKEEIDRDTYAQKMAELLSPNSSKKKK